MVSSKGQERAERDSKDLKGPKGFKALKKTLDVGRGTKKCRERGDFCAKQESGPAVCLRK